MKSIMSHGVLAALVFVAVGIAGVSGGCSTKPPREIDAAVRQRLARYSDAWKQGDAAGVRDSFVARDADDARLLDAIAQLAPAQAQLRNAYYQQLSPTGRIIFGDGDVNKLVARSSQWDYYARAAAHPYVLTYKKPYVLVQLDKDDKQTIIPARNVGGWKLEPGGFAHGRSTAQLADATQLAVRQTNELTAAVRSGETREIQRVMLKHIGETAADARGPLREQMRDILSDGSGGSSGGSGSATTARPTTMRSGAKENPP